ncbi:MAG TPA: hypothetical protein VJ994_14785, partial [Paracoccaceae bacterium]|nr:hypothetical protein [Paracoccaceae bacterium]
LAQAGPEAGGAGSARGARRAGPPGAPSAATGSARAATGSARSACRRRPAATACRRETRNRGPPEAPALGFAPVEGGRENDEPAFPPAEIIGAGEEATSEPAEEKAAGAVVIELPTACRPSVRGGFYPDAVARLARGLGG